MEASVIQVHKPGCTWEAFVFCFKCVHMCMCMHVCLCVLPHTRARLRTTDHCRGQGTILGGSPTLFDRGSLLFTTALSVSSSYYSHKCAGINFRCMLELQMHAAAYDFTWVLGTQTPTLMHCTVSALSTESPLQPKGN